MAVIAQPFINRIPHINNHPSTLNGYVVEFKPLATLEAPGTVLSEISFVATPTVVEPVKAPVSSSISEHEAKMFIYAHESGNNVNALNSIGCRGLGQACPGSKLPCGADYACQDAWFSQYASERYGGWINAYQWWIIHKWW